MSDLSFKSIQVELEEKLQHPYLKQFIKKPVINNDKLVILYNLVEQTSYTDKEKKSYIITTMLVQIALDTHDLVSEKHDFESKQTTKSRQLTVLAGDYFSGLYYYILAKLEDITMIATLASAIKEINEIKMSMLYDENQSVQQWIDRIKSLESMLIVRVANHMNNHSINTFAEEWLLTRRLLREQMSVETNKPSDRIEQFTEHLSKDQLLSNQAIEPDIRKHFSLSKDLFYQIPEQFQFLITYAQSFFTVDYNHYMLSTEEG
ncbi:heptaprenyl diphosphate synthase component 1 [Paraliobacillus salinarum]|uniref:heptaprenyl diphosphate synthase component 1 n=1 Tax=Paraliobacillus salinarum TaxID=1158996 RepID=UPI0015F76F2D|nr:heptaprenyl diphosphate synthase component 1 [Paraliobacillus salinarum]